MYAGDVLWTPPADARERFELGRYLAWLRDERGLDFAGYDALWRWSVSDLDGFWASIWDFFEVRAHAPYERVLGAREMPGAEWFPGARLNYAEHMLGRDEDLGAVAVVARLAVARAVRADASATCASRSRGRASGLQRLGVERGRPRRRVPPEHPGDARRVPRGREPRRGLGDVPAGVRRPQRPRPPRPARADGAARGRRLPLGRQARRPRASRSPRCARGCRRCATSSTSRMPAATATRCRTRSPGTTSLRDGGPLEFDPVPFAHPLYVLFSSGTTGLPKAIVHGHGGILVEHLKNHGFSWDLRPGDRLQWFTTTAWMMWNALVSTLLLRASIVMIDGNPALPRPVVPVAARRGDAADDARAQPGVHDRLPEGGARAGAPLRPRRRSAWSAPPARRCRSRATSGSTSRSARTCSSTSAAAARTSARASCRAIRCCPSTRARCPAAASASTRRRSTRTGKPVVGELGELVIRQPMPSMPVAFWNDPDGDALPRRLLRPLPGRLALRRLDHLHRARQLGDHRPLRRDAQPRRRPARDERVLRRRRGARRGARQPRRPPRGRRTS